MENSVSRYWTKLWDTWNIRGFIIFSLSLQTFLIIFAPLRKRMATTWVIMPLWSAYLLADWAANFAIGLISSSPGKASGPVNNADLLAFWAPFLLVHLGGPDTITAFALQDNELWLRHLLGFIFQYAASLNVLFQSLPKNILLIPTISMFVAGFIKYLERTRALYLASLGIFRNSMLKEPDPGPNYAKLMNEYFSKKEANVPSRIELSAETERVIKAANEVKEDDLSDLEVLQNAHRFFETFKGLIVDVIFGYRERNQSRDFFLKRTAEQAFRIVEVELNFIYDVLVTKTLVVHDIVGYIFRVISFGSVLASLVLFYKENKRGFEGFDVGITYTLLLGAIALHRIVFLMLITSDWTSVALKNLEDKYTVFSMLSKLLYVDRKRWVDDSTKPRSFCLGLSMCVQHILNRRWSESISRYNLIYYCLHNRPKSQENFIGFLGLTGFLNERTYVKRESFTKELRDFIFKELKKKSKMADDLETAKEICAARGDWVLRIEGWSTLLPYIVDVDYDQSLILWHIATELCYSIDVTDNTGKGCNRNKYRDFSMLLSDYMLYLLVIQPTLTSKVASIGQIRFRDTCAEANKFFYEENLKRKKTHVCLGVKKFFSRGKSDEGKKQPHACPNIAKFFGRGKLERDEIHIRACQSILAVNTDVKPVTVKGDRSKSVLFDASILAKELKKLEMKYGKDKWEIISRVWVELLSYAASHCRADNHAQQLSKGGELVTLVWLLMANLGLGVQFQINEGYARAKLIVGK